MKRVVETPQCVVQTGTVVIDELTRILTHRFKYSPQSLQRVLLFAEKRNVVRTPKTEPPVPVRDPDDALVLASALEAQADVLVTGDKDLLVLEDTAGIKIVEPRTLWEMLAKEEGE